MMAESDSTPLPIGIVGRVTAGPNAGLYIEIDDDTKRPRGSGGYYILLWNDAVGYDEWYESAGDVMSVLPKRRIEWLSEVESASIPGRHRHDEL
jgi:hypothetical protein